MSATTLLQDIQTTNDIVSEVIYAYEINAIDYDVFLDCCYGNVDFLAKFIDKIPNKAFKKEIYLTLASYYNIVSRTAIAQ